MASWGPRGAAHAAAAYLSFSLNKQDTTLLSVGSKPIHRHPAAYLLQHHQQVKTEN
jgi:hypothetical protein